MIIDIPHCDSPIDIMYLIHNALRVDAAEVEQRARHLGTADALVAFAQVFRQWMSALESHAVIEDTYMTPLLPARPVVRDNEVEHQRLTALFHEIAAFLQAVSPQTPITPRLQRQVLGQVITLRIVHDDHLESEEDLVLPLVRQRLSEVQQCAIVRRLLGDGGTQEEAERYAWLMASLTTTTQQMLADLSARWALVPHRASPPCAAMREEPPPTSLPGNAAIEVH